MDSKMKAMETKMAPDVLETGWAWVVLAGCFLCRLLTDGMISSLGVFIIAWREYFPGSLMQLTWITSLLAGVTYIVGPLGSALCKKFDIRQVVMGGAIVTSASFMAASMASSVWHLYITFTLAGVGLGLSYQPSFVILTCYFDRRLARANGFVSAGSAIGMFSLPPLLQTLITTYSWQGAILILAGLEANIGVCAALYRPTNLEIVRKTSIKNKPISTQPRAGCINKIIATILEIWDFHLLKSFFFILILISYCLYGVYIIAFHYLSARAVEAGISDLNAAYLVSAIGIGSLVSRVTHGYIIDHRILSACGLTSLSYLLCSIACAVTPLSDSYAFLMTVGIVIGVSAGVYHSTVPIIAKDSVGVDHVSGAVGWILLAIGGGVMLGSYSTGVLFDATGSYSFPFYLAAGCFMMCSLLIAALPITNYLRRRQRRTFSDVHMKPLSTVA
ncbi:monocarboxylate transporter 12-like isoform X2 [Amphiura filiformis]|uniref:monocarboxylate transporter 12-like isoform X2 n=1 Tax=Amphiura filiformis TaxID=82378 RepID=UPI003B222B87